MCSLLGRELKVYINNPGCMTKMAAISIYGNLNRVFRTRCPRSYLMSCVLEWRKLFQSNLMGKIAVNYQMDRRFYVKENNWIPGDIYSHVYDNYFQTFSFPKAPIKAKFYTE